MKYLLFFGGILRSIVRLGPWQALKLHVLAPRMDRRFSIHVRGFDQPVSIRGRTTNAWILNQLLVCREYGGLLKSPPQRIIDGGANIGLASVFWSHEFPGVEIIAVEPDSDNYELLTLNTKHLSNVTPVHGGVWSKTTKLSVLYVKAEKYAIQVVEDQECGTIRGYGIEELLSMRDWDSVDVVKLDVEGSEVEILRDNSERWIDRIGTLIVELHPTKAPAGAGSLFKAFSGQEIELSWRGENLVVQRLQYIGTAPQPPTLVKRENFRCFSTRSNSLCSSRSFSSFIGC